jgi:hypothetical protein
MHFAKDGEGWRDGNDLVRLTRQLIGIHLDIVLVLVSEREKEGFFSSNIYT